MKRRFLRVRGSFLFPLFLLVCTCRPGELLIYLSAVLTHELGHLFALAAAGVQVTDLTLSLTGASIRTGEDLIPYKKEIQIYLAGPTANLAGMAAGFFLLRASFTKSTLLFFFSHALLCFFNLLPIEGLDGHGAILALLSLRLEPDRACRIAARLHRISLFLLLFLSLLTVLRFQNPSLLILCGALALEKKRKSYDLS